MKTITRRDCELMWVWDGDGENPKTTQAYVVAILPNGRCITLGNYGDRFVSRQHCATIGKEKAKKWVPCECRNDLPKGYFDGWIRDKNDNTKRRVGSCWLEECGQIMGVPWGNMLVQYEWSPTFDGPWQPIGKMVEVDGK